MKNKPLVGTAIALLLFTIAFYFCCGLFVIQPIGAIPEGATIVYWRLNMNLPFISSADGLLLEKTGSVSLLGRAIAFGKIAEPIVERKIVKLPYSRQLYLFSTGGKEFEKYSRQSIRLGMDRSLADGPALSGAIRRIINSRRASEPMIGGEARA